MKDVYLKTVETMRDTDSIFQLYRVDMQEVINSIYQGLMNDKEFIKQMKCEQNDKQTIYQCSYKYKVETLIEDLIDPDKGDQCMLRYNLMRDDFTFYDKWRKELFDYIYKQFRG